MHRDDLQKLNPSVGGLAIGNAPEWANDTVTAEECEEFSQEHMGEYIVDTVEMNEEYMLTLFDKDNDYLRGWTKDQKIEWIRKTISSDKDEYSSLPVNELLDPESPIWTRPDEALYVSSGGDVREATVHFNGDFYYVKMYEYGKLLETRELEGKSERYAEDCAENWALSILQGKKTAEGDDTSSLDDMALIAINRSIIQNLEDFNEWREAKNKVPLC
tara:strand:- start:1267 stop:1917 length:651 start_codon:yes stop_codon:yes gene_type:complete